MQFFLHLFSTLWIDIWKPLDFSPILCSKNKNSDWSKKWTIGQKNGLLNDWVMTQWLLDQWKKSFLEIWQISMSYKKYNFFIKEMFSLWCLTPCHRVAKTPPFISIAAVLHKFLQVDRLRWSQMYQDSRFHFTIS